MILAHAELVHDLATAYGVLPFPPVHGRADILDQPARLLRMHRVLELGHREKKDSGLGTPKPPRNLREEALARIAAERDDGEDDDGPEGPFAATVRAAQAARAGVFPPGVDEA